MKTETIEERKAQNLMKLRRYKLIKREEQENIISLLAKATNCVQMSGGDSMPTRKMRVEVFDDDARTQLLIIIGRQPICMRS